MLTKLRMDDEVSQLPTLYPPGTGEQLFCRLYERAIRQATTAPRVACNAGLELPVGNQIVPVIQELIKMQLRGSLI